MNATECRSRRSRSELDSYLTVTGNRVTNDGVYRYEYDLEGNVVSKIDGSGDGWSYTLQSTKSQIEQCHGWRK